MPRLYGPARDFVETASAYTGSECLEWPFATVAGYGRVNIEGESALVHRLVCERRHGPPPPRAQAAHGCGNRTCVNPGHLRWATPIENASDRIAHGTDCRGDKHPQRILTEHIVREVRRRVAAGESQASLAREFGVHRHTIGSAVHGKSWKHI